jgi:hypothetical protein
MPSAVRPLSMKQRLVWWSVLARARSEARLREWG